MFRARSFNIAFSLFLVRLKIWISNQILILIYLGHVSLTRRPAILVAHTRIAIHDQDTGRLREETGKQAEQPTTTKRGRPAVIQWPKRRNELVLAFRTEQEL